MNMKSENSMSLKDFVSGSYWRSPIRGGTMFPPILGSVKTISRHAIYLCWMVVFSTRAIVYHFDLSVEAK